jgi:hypothetical protein
VALAPAKAGGIAGDLRQTAPEDKTPAPMMVLRPLSGWSGEPLLTLRFANGAPDSSLRAATVHLKNQVLMRPDLV